MTFSGGLQKVAVITNVAQEHRLKRIGVKNARQRPRVTMRHVDKFHLPENLSGRDKIYMPIKLSSVKHNKPKYLLPLRHEITLCL